MLRQKTKTIQLFTKQWTRYLPSWLLAQKQDISFNCPQQQSQRRFVPVSSVANHSITLKTHCHSQHHQLPHCIAPVAETNKQQEQQQFWGWRPLSPRQSFTISRGVLIHAEVPRIHLSCLQTSHIRSKQKLATPHWYPIPRTCTLRILKMFEHLCCLNTTRHHLVINKSIYAPTLAVTITNLTTFCPTGYIFQPSPSQRRHRSGILGSRNFLRHQFSWASGKFKYCGHNFSSFYAENIRRMERGTTQTNIAVSQPLAISMTDHLWMQCSQRHVVHHPSLHYFWSMANHSTNRFFFTVA